MCKTVILSKSGIECETVRELINALPEVDLIADPFYNELDYKSCLCQIYVDATLNKAGIKWKHDRMKNYVCYEK